MKFHLYPGSRRLISSAVLVLSCGLFSACSVRLPTHASNQTKKETAPLFKWWGDDTSGPAAIKINLDEQKAVIYRGGQEAGWTILASGTTKHPTPSGTFYVMEKIQDKVSNTYGVIMNEAGEVVNWDAKAGVTSVPAGCRFVGAQMPYWMRITSYGVGMHAGDIPEPGLPASHGCIRLPRDFAGTLYNVVDVGTQVTITGTGQYVAPLGNGQPQAAQTRTSETTPARSSSVASLR
ncbi:MAG: L,D-transpeptidase [Verrucomicrobia bacterium]|nr:L,D-transpeptidase [Verrucomicrobiota bacterium]